MKLSIIVITANPTEKQYAWKEALASYCDIADEVIIVDGGEEPIVYPDTKVRVVYEKDPEVWNWAEHAKRLNKGLEEATGDWIIKADIDWIFHQESKHTIRERLGSISTLIATMQKMTFYPGMRYVQKGQVPIIINGKFKANIRFGKDLNTYTDLTYPILWKGEMDEQGVPLGEVIMDRDWGKTRIEFWNFDYTFKTLDVAKKLFLRGSMAHKEYFGTTSWGNTEQEAFDVFMNNMRSKLKHSTPVDSIRKLPKHIHERIENLKPEQFGYNGWGLL